MDWTIESVKLAPRAQQKKPSLEKSSSKCMMCMEPGMTAVKTHPVDLRLKPETTCGRAAKRLVLLQLRRFPKKGMPFGQLPGSLSRWDVASVDKFMAPEVPGRRFCSLSVVNHG